MRTIDISLICSVFSLNSALVYLLLRFGYPTEYFPVIKVVGLSLVVFILPVFIKLRFTNKSGSKWYFNYSFILFSVLFLITLLGLLNRLICFNSLGLSSLPGYILFGWLIVEVFRTTKGLRIVLTTILTIFFSAFIIFIIFTYHIKPLFFEDLFSWSYLWKVDTLYHIANSQMFNTYGIFSTGLDGISYIPYHYGSNVLYCGLANFLNISLIDTYILLPAIITAPLFICTFFHLILFVRKFFGISNDINKLFILVLLTSFIGFFMNTRFQSMGDFPDYASMFLGSPILFISDSYTVSLVFMSILFILILNYCQDSKTRKINVFEKSFFYYLVLPILFICLGFSKISTLYVVFLIISFLIIRLRLYKDVIVFRAFLIIAGSFIILFFIMRDSKYGDGNISWMYHFKEAKQNIVIFIAIQFVWFWILLVSFLTSKSTQYNLSHIGEKKLLVEVVFVMILSALVPAFFIKIRGGQLYYFTEIQSWYSVSIILAYLPLFNFDGLTIFKKKVVIKTFFITLICLWLAVIWFLNIRIYRNEMIRANYSTRYNVLIGPKGLIDPGDFSKPFKLIYYDSLMLASIRQPFESEFYDSSRVEPAKAFITKLSNLNKLPLTVKKKSLIYINFENLGFDLPLRCYEIPFLAPALSGMASIKSGLNTDCSKANSWFSGYGYEYYDSIDGSSTNLHELKSIVLKKGYSWLYYYDIKSREFIHLNCQRN